MAPHGQGPKNRIQSFSPHDQGKANDTVCEALGVGGIGTVCDDLILLPEKYLYSGGQRRIVLGAATQGLAVRRCR